MNGKSIYAGLEVGEDIAFNGKDYDGNVMMSLYHQPRARKARGFFVRKVSKIGSLYTFEKSIDSSVPGTLCLELTGPSKATMTAQRNRLKNEYEYRLEEFLRTIAKDKSTALRKTKNAVDETWEGESYRSDNAGELAAILHQVSGAPETFWDVENLKKVRSIFEENEKKQEEAGVGTPKGDEGPQSGVEHVTPEDAEGAPEKLNTFMPPELVEMTGELVPGTGASTIDATIRLMSHGPRFRIRSKMEDFRVPKKLRPTDKHGKPTISGPARKLAKFWGEVCRAILFAYDKGSFTPYGIGWLFETDYIDGSFKTIEGECVTNMDGGKWLMLNPYHKGLVGGKFYSLRSLDDLKYIWAIAMHECAHLVSTDQGHGDGYARTITDVIHRCGHTERLLKKIRDICVKGKAKKEKAPKAAASDAKRPFDEELEAELILGEKRLMDQWWKKGSGTWGGPGARGYGNVHVISLETVTEPKSDGDDQMRASVYIDNVPIIDAPWFSYERKYADDWSILAESGYAQDVQRAIHEALELHYNVQFYV